MPVYLTEFTGADLEGHVGPYIYAANSEEAHYVCGFLFADPYGDVPLRVAGAVADHMTDPLEAEHRGAAVRAEMERIIRETPR